MKRLITLLSLMIVINCFSQETENQWMLNIGVSFPTGEFASEGNDIENNLSANIGGGINLQYNYFINKNIGAFAGIGANYNGIKMDFKKKYESYEIMNSDITTPKYLNFPISVGVIGKTNSNKQVSLYGNAGVILNFIKITNYKIDVSDVDYETILIYKLANSVGFKVGGGLILNEKYSIALNYINAGNARIKYEWDTSNWSGSTPFPDGTMESNIGYLTLGLGYLF